MNNHVIYIAGPDGCGKTTYLKEIEQYLIIQGESCRHVWLRSPKILSKPLMVYCRFVGLTKYKIIDGVKYGKHEFYRSKLVSWLFPILQLWDFKIKWYLFKRKLSKKSILLFDRFSLDTLADLMVDTQKWNLHKTWLGRSFVRIIPVNNKTIVLNADEERIKSRKKDTLYDENLSAKIHAFEVLSKDLNLTVIDNNKNYKIVKSEIFKYML